MGFNARSYAVANVPAVLANDVDIQAYLAGPESVTSFQRREITIPTEGGKYNGANLLVGDFLPGGFSALHRTVNIDFVVCCLGSIIHGKTSEDKTIRPLLCILIATKLDSGERVVLKPGVN